MFYIISLFDEPVTVTIQAPEEATTGSSIIVQVTINKGNISSFARFQQTLPVGYTAEPVNVPTGDFIFKDQRVIVGWLNLPNDEQITFSYKINIDPTAEGPLFLTGVFSYIENNERKNVESPTVSVIIRPAGANLYAQQQDTSKTTQEGVVSGKGEEYNLDNVFCYRQIVQQNNEFVVSILVNTANLPRDKFAKIQEKIPLGYTAFAIETNDGIFSFKDNTVKFLWMSLPPQKQFVVSYKLIPNEEIAGTPDLSGSFSYVENEATKIKSIINKDFLNAPIMAMVEEQKRNVSNNQIPVSTENNLTAQIIESKKEEKQSYTSKEQKQLSTKQKGKTNIQETTQESVTMPEIGVKYRVQIAAAHRVVNTKTYFKQFNIYEPVKIEQHEGWHKYTIGSFGLYKEARDKRVQIWNTTPIHDAFVTAYNNGVRITVQEALMITNQKWVQ